MIFVDGVPFVALSALTLPSAVGGPAGVTEEGLCRFFRHSRCFVQILTVAIAKSSALRWAWPLGCMGQRADRQV